MITDQSLVFFVESPCQNTIRIGSSKDFSSRFRKMQSANSCPIKILGVIPTPKHEELEKLLQEKFEEYRHHHKWFRKAPKLLRFIKKETVAFRPAEKEAPENFSDLEPLLTVEQAAKVYRRSETTIRRYVNNNAIPHLRYGKQIRFQKEEIREYLLHKPSG